MVADFMANFLDCDLGVKGGAGCGSRWYFECGRPTSKARATARPSVRTTARAGK